MDGVQALILAHYWCHQMSDYKPMGEA